MFDPLCVPVCRNVSQYRFLWFYQCRRQQTLSWCCSRSKHSCSTHSGALGVLEWRTEFSPTAVCLDSNFKEFFNVVAVLFMLQCNTVLLHCVLQRKRCQTCHQTHCGAGLAKQPGEFDCFPPQWMYQRFLEQKKKLSILLESSGI